MNNTNGIPSFGQGTLAELEDAQLDAVTGGTAHGVINAKAVARPEPLYPPIAK